MQPNHGGKRPGRSSRKRLAPKGNVPGRPPHGPSAPKKSKRSVRPTKSFSAPAPSSAPIAFQAEKMLPRGVWLSHLFGLIGVVCLILLGGGQNIYALAVSLLLPGIALIVYPPKQGLGKLFDCAALVFLGVFLFAFLPQIYWPDPEWRKSALDLVGLDLSGVLSIRPLMSFEAWISVCAGIAWFYAAMAWPINFNGRKWLYVTLSVVLCIMAGLVFWGNVSGFRYPASAASPDFSFFANRNQTASFLAIGGIVSFGFAMSNLRAKLFTPFLGFVASGLCLAALFSAYSRSGLFLFLGGITLWYLLQLKAGQTTRGLRIGFPLVLVALSLFVLLNGRTTERLIDYVSQPSGWTDEYRPQVYSDALSMIKGAPLTGYGLGTFDAIFPQYREASANHHYAVDPGSDLLWLVSEGGLVALVAFGVLAFAFLRKCRGLSDGNSGLYRMIALLAVGLFLLHGLVDVSAHQPGTAYFVILLAACALPKAKRGGRGKSPHLLRWRIAGGVLVAFGLAWLLAGVSGLPLHSKVALERNEKHVQEAVSVGDFESGLAAVEKWLEWRPTDWRAHHQYGVLTLADNGGREDAERNFERARFVEPTLAEVTYEEGLIWLGYDVRRAVAAWRETLAREMENPDDTFYLMLREAENNRDLFEGMARVSEIDPYYRAFFLNYQEGDRLMEELNRELATDRTLAGFNREQRTSIVRNWILRGDAKRAEAFLEKNGTALNQSWWLWSLLLKNKALFEEASNQIRNGVEPPEVPFVKVDELKLESLMREFTVAPTDIMKGTALMRIYIEEDDYESVLDIADAMARSQRKVPPYVLYWKAESLFQLRDFIESWYTFETYLESVWSEE